jgi:hypothetical protein
MYEFHGIGCFFTWPDGSEINFDFSMDDGTIGVDAWRVWEFIRQFPSEFPGCDDGKRFEEAFNAAVMAGVLRPSGGLSNLYFLTS